jgi:flagellar hook protein FlgE
MSIMRSMYNGVSGLLSSSQALGIVGDNIANVNTIGYKRSRGVFADIMGQTVPGASPSNQVGGGTRLADVQQLFNQGALLTTDGQADLAVSGEGFFAVSGNISGRQGTFYTRAGQFRLDNDGFMTTPDGLRLQGYGVTADGRVDTRIGDLQIGDAELSPNATSEVSMSLNLDSGQEVIAGAIDPNDPDSYNFSTSVTVYDSLGEAHRVDVFFQKTGDNTWDYEAYCDGGDIAGGTAGTPTLISSGGGADSLDFTAEGALDVENGGTVAVTFGGGAAAQSFTLDFGSSITTDGGTGLDATTQFADRPSSLNGLDQDGFPAGSVVGFAIAGDGVVTGVYDNGQQRTLGQVVTATFTSNEGLTRVGNNCWAESIDSGQALVGTPSSGGSGSIIQGALEQSNVDIATEFVGLIAHQRAFQANGRTITTADEMYNSAIQLKR